MSIRTKRTRKLEPLPTISVEQVLSQKAVEEIRGMEDRIAHDQMDFDPILDVEQKSPFDTWEYHASQRLTLDDPSASAIANHGAYIDEKIGPECFGGSDFDLDPASYTPVFSRDGFDEAEELMKKMRAEKQVPQLDSTHMLNKYIKGSEQFYPEEAWIQTYSGKRFTPIKPNANAIVIQDIAHALAMQCRFSGHVKYFYSVAQHCVLVSYICDQKDALWGLMHDATEAYLVDVPRPLKRSGKFGAYIECERVMQNAICTRFELSPEEPESVHRADTIMLATEARDLMQPLRYDWTQPVKPLPFKIEPLGPREAKLLYLERFFELIGSPDSFNRYLEYEAHGAI